MTTITTRVPKVDWSNGFDRHWYGGNAAVTHTFNALSFLFPQGEKFFIDTAREVASETALSNNAKLHEAVKDFIAQESIHAHLHNQYNAVLQSQGFENIVYTFIQRLQTFTHLYCSPFTKLAVVCAYEHYTAILGNFILSNPQTLQPAKADMALVWGWHSAEETEHKAVCFDLYQAAGGRWFRRVIAFLLVTLNFSLMFGRLYFSLLWRDGCLKPSRIFGTVGHFLKFFFGVPGTGWHLFCHGLRYLSPGFHPWNQNNRDKLQIWLSCNRAKLREVGGHHER